MRQLFLMFAAVLLAAPAASPAGAQSASFVLINNTDIPFQAIKVRPYGSQQWRDIVIVPVPVAAAGGRGNVDFSDPDCAFDLQASLPDGTVVVWPRVNLCETKIVTLNRSASGELWVDYR